MVEVTGGSTIPKRQLGRYLCDLRNRVGMTVAAAAAELEWSPVKIWRIEIGRNAMRGHDVELMCGVYGADDEMTRALVALAKETKKEGWWHAYSDVYPPGFDIYIGLEGAASDLAAYESDFVHGLFQTEDYARQLIGSIHKDEAEVERRVHVRMARQMVLTRRTKAPRVEVLLDEAITRRPIGGPEVMAGQLWHLAEIGEMPNVSIRVVPFDMGLHPGVVAGQFTVLTFPEGRGKRDTEVPTVYQEGLTGVLYLDKPHEVAQYTEVFAEIREVALSEPASQALLGAAAKGFAR